MQHFLKAQVIQEIIQSYNSCKIHPISQSTTYFQAFHSWFFNYVTSMPETDLMDRNM
jgi:hypothetical protein